MSEVRSGSDSIVHMALNDFWYRPPSFADISTRQKVVLIFSQWMLHRGSNEPKVDKGFSPPVDLYSM